MAANGKTNNVGTTTKDRKKKDFKDSKVEGKKDAAKDTGEGNGSDAGTSLADIFVNNVELKKSSPKVKTQIRPALWQM